MRPVHLLVLLALAGPARAEDTAQAANLRSLIDQPVYTAQGDSLGLLNAVAVNVGTGEVPWGIILSGRNLVVIPIGALEFNTSGLLELAMSPQEYQQAPRWRSTQLPLLNQPAAVKRIAETYGFDLKATQGAVAAAGEGTPFRLIGVPIPWAPAEDFSTRMRLIGDRVATVDARAVGTIVDLLVELKSAKVRLVAVEAEGKRLGLPYSSLVWQPNARAFVADLDLETIKRQPRAEWPRGPLKVPAAE